MLIMAIRLCYTPTSKLLFRRNPARFQKTTHQPARIQGLRWSGCKMETLLVVVKTNTNCKIAQTQPIKNMYVLCGLETKSYVYYTVTFSKRKTFHTKSCIYHDTILFFRYRISYPQSYIQHRTMLLSR